MWKLPVEKEKGPRRGSASPNPALAASDYGIKWLAILETPRPSFPLRIRKSLASAVLTFAVALPATNIHLLQAKFKRQSWLADKTARGEHCEPLARLSDGR